MQLEPILGIHNVLYEEFSKKSALTPNFAEIFNKHADFLKICSGFFLVKKDLTDELLTAMDQNKYLAQAVRLFEEEILNAPEGGSNLNGSSSSISQNGISLVMHLDAVHQNVVRYILLMERYRKLLPDGIAECEIADKAIAKLKSVSQSINCSLMDPEYTHSLMEIHRKLQGDFDVLSPSRRLVHEGRLMKQTRKELQERHLVLFSDWIIIGRYTYPFDYFDPAKSYRLQLKGIEIKTDDHIDHETEFYLINPRKSMTFVAKSKQERNAWVDIIRDTRDKWIESQRKLQEQRRKMSFGPIQVTRQSIHDENKTPTEPDIGFSTLKDQTPTNGDTVLKIPTQSVLWIPDNKATKCMMQQCEVKFTTIKRRHHCRNCGYLICGNCSGKAPVKVNKFECQKVCSDCYDQILSDFVQLIHFPRNMVRLSNQVLAKKSNADKSTVHPSDLNHDEDNTKEAELIEILKDDPFSDAVRIVYDNGVRSTHPRDLFKEPTNKHYRRAQTKLETIDNRRNSHESTLLVSGKVHLHQKKGHCQIRWARLDSDFSLNFYEAELDAVPIDTFFLFGYSVFVNDNLRPGNGTEFTLLHQNQVKTERKDLKLVFRVENFKAAEDWRDALLNKLELPIADQTDI
ncbi:Pleckstrin-like proteiny and Zinc finger domain containing protein [Aphelenchoides bicaudatus]|nr:Pleckstrin-like proteiny and Zinc finger domain containing protein [Aphelenchoides bicaudatus]